MPHATVRQTGPWSHKNISAAGVSFHVASAGDGPHTVLLLHDFPLYWWTWRAQLPALADAGYRVVALDLRGFGGSDLQPGDVPLRRLSTDISSVIHVLGTDSYTLVGAGMSGTLGWLLAHRAPLGLKSLVTISSPHPLSGSTGRVEADSRAAKANRLARYAWRQRRGLQKGRLEEALLTGWAAPASREAMAALVPTYSSPMRRRFAAQAAHATFDATRRIRLRDRKLFATPVPVPVLSLRGEEDPSTSRRAYADDALHVSGGYLHLEVPGCGRYLSEEAPAALNELLLTHLSRVAER